MGGRGGGGGGGGGGGVGVLACGGTIMIGQKEKTEGHWLLAKYPVLGQFKATLKGKTG